MGRTLGGYAFPPFPYLFTIECGTHPGDTTTNQMSTTSGIFPLHYEGVQHVTHTHCVSDCVLQMGKEAFDEWLSCMFFFTKSAYKCVLRVKQISEKCI